jgi:hypothetical protein
VTETLSPAAIDETVAVLLETVAAIQNLEDVRQRLLLELADAADNWEQSLLTDQYEVVRTTKPGPSVLNPEAIVFAQDAGLLNEQEMEAVYPLPERPPQPPRKVSLKAWNKLLKARPQLQTIDERHRQSGHRPGPVVVRSRTTGADLGVVS